MSDDTITLTVPALPDFVRLARLTVASVATKVGFDYDEVEDLRIAVGEACALLIGSTGIDGTLTLTFDLQPGRVEVEVRRTPADDVPLGEGSELSTQILDAVVDEHRVSSEAGLVELAKAVSSG